MRIDQRWQRSKQKKTKNKKKNKLKKNSISDWLSVASPSADSSLVFFPYFFFDQICKLPALLLMSVLRTSCRPPSHLFSSSQVITHKNTTGLSLQWQPPPFRRHHHSPSPSPPSPFPSPPSLLPSLRLSFWASRWLHGGGGGSGVILCRLQTRVLRRGLHRSRCTLTGRGPETSKRFTTKVFPVF